MASWLTRKAPKVHDEVAAMVYDFLRSIEGTSPLQTEAGFRDATMSYMRAVFRGAELKREAGVQGTGTRIDIYAHIDEHDYLITIKKGLSEQKVKKVIGELNIFLDRWMPRVKGKQTYIVFLAFGMTAEKEIEALTPFNDFAARANAAHAGSFYMDCVLSVPPQP